MGDKLPWGGAEGHYDVLSFARLTAYALPEAVQAAPSAVLFLWRLSAMPLEAIQLCHAWGFTPKTELVWLKRTATGKRHFGMGRYLRAEHETCLVATFGKAFPEIRNVRSTFEAPTGIHSSKPDEFYSIVEALYPSSDKYEIFARKRRPGWVQSGLELEAQL